VKPRSRKALYWSAFLSAGPITGPLLEGVWRNWRKGERVLAALYAVAAALVFVTLPAVVLEMIANYAALAGA
jgi:hypothetical protein